MSRRQPLQNVSNFDRSKTTSSTNYKILHVDQQCYVSQSNITKRECFEHWKKHTLKKDAVHFATPKKRKLDDEAVEVVDELLKFSFFSSSEPRKSLNENNRPILRTPHSTKRVSDGSGRVGRTMLEAKVESDSPKLRKFPTFDEPAEAMKESPQSHRVSDLPENKPEPTTTQSQTKQPNTDDENHKTNSYSSTEKSCEDFHGQVASSIKTSLFILNRTQSSNSYHNNLHSNYENSRENLIQQSISKDMVTFHSLPDVQLKLRVWKVRYQPK